MTHPSSIKNGNHLYTANTFGTFWQVLVEQPITQEEWDGAAQKALSVLSMEQDIRAEDILPRVLGEAAYGPKRWQLSKAKRLYYQVKPLLPRALRTFGRQHYRHSQEAQLLLKWPVEDRYVRFQFQCLNSLLGQRGLSSMSYVNFWPAGHRYAFVLTHDIEEERGATFVREVADLEERYGFRSVFNFVPERYPIDTNLLQDLKQRGFEIGVHGLKHDGKLFSSRSVFERRAAKINQYLRTWGAVGFRAPYTHRNPEWMQALDVEYDLSFFDTDPHEPLPGGTMSIWPFQLGKFMELPYTLTQDNTLANVLRAQTPELWTNKVDFIAQWHGMALVNVHPDYLRSSHCWRLYEDFLKNMQLREGYWHALPRDVARWWQQRMQFQAQYQNGQWNLASLQDATSAQFRYNSQEGFSRYVYSL
jgi:peptidoglycan/xylan/chitin deacetylase (PgdA/CDA1 family)